MDLRLQIPPTMVVQFSTCEAVTMGLGLSAGERRRDPRIPTELPAHCQVNGDYTRGAVIDVSRSGLGLKTEKHIPAGAPLQVAMALPFSDGPRFCSLSGTVVRSAAHWAAVKIDGAVPKVDREVLHGFLALLQVRRQAMQ